MEKFSTHMSFDNKCDQTITVSNSNNDIYSSSTVIHVKEEDKSEFRIYLSSNEEIDTLIQMLQKIKDWMYMNKTTAQQLLLAYAEVQDALKRIRTRQVKIDANELDKFPDSFADFRYFGDKLEDALNDIEHRVSDAQWIVSKSYGRD